MLGYLKGAEAGSVDILLSSFAVHHLSLSEKAELVQEVGRVLRPGGCFLLIDVFMSEGGSLRFFYLFLSFINNLLLGG